MNAMEISEEIAVRPGFPDVLRRLGSFFAHELAAQKPRLFYWFPVFLSVGIAGYFALDAEPPMAVGAATVVFSFAAFVLARRARVVCLCIFLVALGFAAAQTRARLVYTPILQRDISVTSVEGRVELIEDMEDGEGSRVVLGDVAIEKLAPRETPKKVRLTVRKDEGLAVGQHVRILAGLQAPSAPLIPGGFDFRRYMYFQGIGALGFAFKPAEILSGPEEGRDVVERLRVAIDGKINAAIPYPQAGIAMALITGRRAGINQDIDDAIMAAGLTHLLSISGLHIGLAAGIIFFITRLLMACVPGMALRLPIKKFAAGFAFAGAVFYTLLAGAPIPAERSMIMVGIALLAVVLDRSPLSMRLVAFAAFAVLLIAPESLMGASFQLSFAAVSALVLVFDWLRPWLSALHRGAGWFKKLMLYFMGVAMTTVIATIATAPLTMFHFQQLTIYGVISNAISVPLSAFLIMPAAVLSLLAMPFGLDYYPLWAVGEGCQWIIEISQWVAGLPHALVKVEMAPGPVLPLAMSGLSGIFLIKGRLKSIAAIPVAAAIFLAATYRLPDILVAPGFEVAAFRDTGGGLKVSTLRREKYTREKWESAYGLPEGSAMAWPKEGQDGAIACDEMACRIELKGKRVAYLKTPSALREECGWADLILSEEPLSGYCGKPVIDKFDALRNGAYAIWLGDKIKIQNAEELRGARPWSSLNKQFKD